MPCGTLQKMLAFEHLGVSALLYVLLAATIVLVSLRTAVAVSRRLVLARDRAAMAAAKAK